MEETACVYIVSDRVILYQLPTPCAHRILQEICYYRIAAADSPFQTCPVEKVVATEAFCKAMAKVVHNLGVDRPSPEIAIQQADTPTRAAMLIDFFRLNFSPERRRWLALRN